MRQVITANWVRITKKQARARYMTRQDVYLLPFKMHPENDNFPPVPIVKSEASWEEALYEMGQRVGFDYLSGYYPAFYMTRKEYDERMGRGFV